MSIFALRNNRLEKIKEVSFRSEKKDIQEITESSLRQIFGLEIVKSEFTIGNLRIDTLAFDKAAKSFVVIEYKMDKSFSVIDQGVAYLASLLNNRADCLLEYYEATNQSLKKTDVQWDQSKVIFVSPSFTMYQKQAINFKDLPIELWEIRKYENNTILFNKLKSPETSASFKEISSKSKDAQNISKEIRIYTEEDHLKDMPEEIEGLYHTLKERILSLGDDIEIRPRQLYIGFIRTSNFADAHLQNSQIKIWINMQAGTLDDPKHIARDVSKIGHWGNGDYEIALKTEGEIDYLMTLIRQSYLK